MGTAADMAVHETIAFEILLRGHAALRKVTNTRCIETDVVSTRWQRIQMAQYGRYTKSQGEGYLRRIPDPPHTSKP
ncbi:hypothetical protein M8818_006800 [Zalaria obscura]|uniref:Uncharacterized protein n=1 Tax=Zalaria obscura TaxID=2024903 RepID=A0ACC3S5W4_9PEZI